MTAPAKSVSIKRIVTASDQRGRGVVKMIHMPTGKFYLIHGAMYKALLDVLEQLGEGTYWLTSLQKAYNAEPDFQFEFYPAGNRDVRHIKKELFSGKHAHLVFS